MVETLHSDKVRRTLPKPDTKIKKSKAVLKSVKKKITKAVRTAPKKKPSTKSIKKTGQTKVQSKVQKRKQKTQATPEAIITESFVVTETFPSTVSLNPIILEYIGEYLPEDQIKSMGEPISLMQGIIDMDAEQPGISMPFQSIREKTSMPQEQVEMSSMQVQVMEPIYIEQTQVAPIEEAIGGESIPFSEVYPEILSSLEDQTSTIVIQTSYVSKGSMPKRIFGTFIAIFTKFAKRNHLRTRNQS